MGIASNKRYQLVKGLRRSLRMVPPFTGRVVRGNDESDVTEPREELDRPAPSLIEIPAQLPAPLSKVPVEVPPAITTTVAVQAAAPAVNLYVPTVEVSPSPPAVEKPAMVASQPPVEVSKPTPEGSPATPSLPRMEPRRGSALSFAAGLVIGVAASSAGWSWMNVQAADATNPGSEVGAPAGSKAEVPGAAVAPKSSTGGTPAPLTKVAAPKPVAAPAVPKTPALPPINAPRAIPASEFDKWKMTQISAMESEFPELHAWVNTVAEGHWRNVSNIVSGGHPSVKARSPAHVALLKWLNLQPPSDPDTRRAVHNMLVRMAPPGECLDLWEPLVQNGAPNTPDIQSAADVLMIMREDKLDAEQKRRMQAIINHPAPKTKS